MFASVRAFFSDRKVMEVDVPMMGRGAPVDTHIDVMAIPLQTGERGFLHTSPEYAMKRLLSLGIGDIYQMSHVFRDGEFGRLHNPEFTMVEWYRVGMAYDALIQETLDFIRLFVGPIPSHSISYRDAFRQFASIDYVKATTADLVKCAHEHKVHLPSDAHHWDKDTLLHFLIGFVVEPHLGKETLTVLRDYPASQSALAQTLVREDEAIAERFEIYFRGVELANGFHELADPDEQRRRFEEDNQERVRLGKNPLPIDEKFLEALRHGLPDCCGVAVGFDRLMLLRHGKDTLESVLPFTWQHA
jgi:lysyl-tRNA synthetase class 2